MTLRLSDLLKRHTTLLVVDCAGTVVHAGVIRADGRAAWRESSKPAGEGLFEAVEAVLREASLSLAEIGAYGFNEGPGSILGIRTSAVAIRSWRSVYPKFCYRFCGLAAFAEALRIDGRAAPFRAIADARRESWHAHDTATAEMKRLPTSEIQPPCVTPRSFKSWSQPPAQTEALDYAPDAFLARTQDLPLWAETDAPDAFAHEEATYRTWAPGIHRAPSA